MTTRDAILTLLDEDPDRMVRYVDVCRVRGSRVSRNVVAKTARKLGLHPHYGPLCGYTREAPARSLDPVEKWDQLLPMLDRRSPAVVTAKAAVLYLKWRVDQLEDRLEAD